ncbi:MAG: protein-L-isoaspartate O-methyltransferase [Burkholderiaceae bacterium]|nr:protein-L-isoaspartate O-methyltransferase [Burkholderiaceae bacterium]
MDFELARFNMVEQQIRPWNVLDQEVLDLLFVLRREEFVPAAFRAMAFTDTEIPLRIDGNDTGESMFSPKLEARLLQSLAIQRHEQVLEIGAGSGYMAALLGHRARRVITREIQPALAGFARANLERAGVSNVTVEQCDGSKISDTTHYEVIMLSGAVQFIPDQFLGRLAIGGRLIAIVGESPLMSARLVTRNAQDAFGSQDLFETSAKPLLGFPTRDRFTF